MAVTAGLLSLPVTDRTAQAVKQSLAVRLLRLELRSALVVTSSLA